VQKNAASAATGDWLDRGLVELAAELRARRVSPVELVDAHIARVQQVNPPLNALIAACFDTARAAARAAEARLAAASADDELPPFLGIPCSIKEYLGLAGMPQTGGYVRERHRVAAADGTVVARIRAAGAIPLGITNGPEGGMWMETHNRIFGRTHNPWDVTRTAGGSSGGEGALVAAGGSVFGLGSDVAGSIRFPAAFCGVVGHKPSGRLVPNTGHWPAGTGEVEAILVIGPLTRRVADVMPILRVIAGPDGQDGHCADVWLGDPEGVNLRDVDVFTLPGGAIVRVDDDMRGSVEAAARALEARGAKRRKLSSPRLKKALEMWSGVMALAEERSFGQRLVDADAGFFAPRELVKLALGKSEYTLPTISLALMELAKPLVGGRLAKAASLARELQAELEAALGPSGVLLHPPYTRVAPKHHRALLTPFDFICCALFSVLEFPVTQVPLGFQKDGLPLGVQVVAGRGADHLTLGVAQALEDHFGGWVRANP
jgi:fatty acid amide hydrolase 2